MADDNNRSPRRRPVDVLFGEEVQLKPTVPEPDTQPAAPGGYMVEPPRPVTSVRPPPPEFPNDWRVNAPPEPATVMEISMEIPAEPDPVAPPPKPALVAPPLDEIIAEAVTFTPPPDDAAGGAARRAQMADKAPPPIFVQAVPAAVPQAAPSAPAPAPAPLYGQTELLELSQFVDQLYQNVADETSDSAALNADCLTNLNLARAAIEKGEYSKAEAAAEQVKSRLLRARASRAAAGAQATKLLYAALLAAALAGIVLLTLPFFFRIVPVIVPLLRGAGLGMLGGAAMALFQLNRQLGRREYDAAFNAKYALSPLFGALIGAVMYLLSLLGILAAPNALGLTLEPFGLMYLFALLGGLFNDVLIDGLRGLFARTNK